MTPTICSVPCSSNEIFSCVAHIACCWRDWRPALRVRYDEGQKDLTVPRAGERVDVHKAGPGERPAAKVSLCSSSLHTISPPRHQCGQGEDGVRLPDTYCIKCSKLSVQSGQLSGVDRRLKPPRGRDTHAHAVATVLPPDDAGERHGVAGPRHIGHVQNQNQSFSNSWRRA